MKKRRALRTAAALAVAAVAFVRAGFVTPSRAADTVSETRPVAGFERIQLDGAFTTQVTAGAGRRNVVVSGDSDVVSRTTTKIVDRTLVVGMRPGSSSAERSVKLQITVPVLRGFANNGAGSANITGLNGGNVDIANAGAASIVASGRAASETISLDGTGKIDTTAVDAHDVTVNNNGVGVVHVRASGLLTMSVNGIGEIRYTCNPSHVDSQVNGIGRIGRL